MEHLKRMTPDKLVDAITEARLELDELTQSSDDAARIEWAENRLGNLKAELDSRPLPGKITEARKAAGLTQEQAGAVVHCTRATWQHWEYGRRVMHPAFWELFKLKTAGHA